MPGHSDHPGIERLRALPDGEAKAAETTAMIDRVRVFASYREYPKYRMISRYWIYKQALLREADRLVAAGVVDARDDVYFLTFDELAEAARTGEADRALIRQRRDEFATCAALTPPRVMTSEGEVLNGSYHRDDVPDGALAGLAVSTGVVALLGSNPALAAASYSVSRCAWSYPIAGLPHAARMAAAILGSP